MALHEVQLKGYSVRPGNLSLGTYDSYGIEQLHVTLDDTWSGLAIDATFHNTPNDKGVTMLVDTDGLVTVPPEACMRASKYATITFRGVQDGVQRISCNLPYMVLDHAQVPGANSTATPSEIAQALAQMQDLRDGAVDAKRHAEAARDAAANSAAEAKEYETNASQSATAAKTAQKAAASSASSASTSASTATTQAAAAKSSADAAASSATAAKASEAAAGKSAQGAAASESAAKAAQTAAETAKANADIAASNAAAKATAAAKSAVAAKESEASASQSATAAANSATAAAGSATAAAGDAKTASDAAAGAADAKAAAVAAQKDAAASKAAAANSSAAAKTSEDAAAKSAADADRTANSINESMTQIAANKEAVSQLKEDIGNVTNSVSDVDSRVDVLEKQVSNMNIDNADLRNIAYDIAKGTAPSKYPVGTKIVTSWDRTAGDGTKTTYNPEWNIVHYSQLAFKDSPNDEVEQTGNAMFLEWDKALPDGISFCTNQALQCFDGTEGSTDGLPAGTYAIKMKAQNGSNQFNTLWNGKYATIVLSKPIPSGGTLRVTVRNWGGTSQSDIALDFKTCAGSNQNDPIIESYTATTSSDTLPDGATYLGEVWGEDVGYGKLNHSDCCYYGDSSWQTSDLRQWLNSEGADWWKKQTRYGIKPNAANSLQGFLTGLDKSVKDVLKYVKVTTIGSNVKYGGQQIVTYDRIFIHSNNQNNITTDYDNQYDNEGERWEYYKQLAQGVSNLTASGMFQMWYTYPILIRYAINAPTSAKNVFGRSGRIGNPVSVYGVLINGACNDMAANNFNTFTLLPACAIMGNEPVITTGDGQ